MGNPAGRSRLWGIGWQMGRTGVHVRYLNEEGTWGAGDCQELVNMGPCCGFVDWLLCALWPSFIWVPVSWDRGLALLSSSRSDQRTIRHRGEVLPEQSVGEVYFPNLGSAYFPHFYSKLLVWGRDLASLCVTEDFERGCRNYWETAKIKS